MTARFRKISKALSIELNCHYPDTVDEKVMALCKKIQNKKKKEDEMYLFLNIVLYIVVAIFLVVFFRKAIEVFLLLSHKISEKYKKEKNEEQ